MWLLVRETEGKGERLETDGTLAVIVCILAMGEVAGHVRRVAVGVRAGDGCRVRLLVVLPRLMMLLLVLLLL
jgi:hypothetical protein